MIRSYSRLSVLCLVNLLAACIVQGADVICPPCCTAEGGSIEQQDDKFVFVSLAGDQHECHFSARWSFPQWETNTWVFLPSCAYNGNRDFTGISVDPPVYPPCPTSAGKGLEPRREMVKTIPALQPDGSGEIEITAGDMAVPCAGFFFPEQKRGVLIYTEAQISGEPLGFTIRQGELRVDYPACRKFGYRFVRDRQANPDKKVVLAAGARIVTRWKRFDFEAKDISTFLERFFRTRRSVMSDVRAPNGYDAALWSETEKCWNRHMFVEGAYCQERTKWAPGWIFNQKALCALYTFGGEETRSRCRKTLDFMCDHQTEQGVFVACRVGEGRKRKHRVSRQAGNELTDFFRMHCDGTLGLLRCLDVIGETPRWVKAAERGADAIVRVWRRHGQLGQWVDSNSLDIIVGRSDACAIAPAALVAAWRRFKKPQYLEVAKSICDDYCVRDLHRGVLYGGIADAIMAPDSESGVSLLESCMALAEATGESHWIDEGRKCAAYLSTWVMTYAYQFPQDSELYRHRVNSVGSVFANAQNKHAAPGFATHSARGLLLLYRMTGDKAYLELLRDTVYFIPQSVSREENPYITVGGRKLDAGFICERVNTSDWEGKKNVGGSIFYASCWCGSALLSAWFDFADEPEFMLHTNKIIP